MTLFYAPTQKGFFDDVIHNVIPKDALPISQVEHQALLEANSQGARIELNDQSRPVAVFPSEAQQLIAAKTQAHQHLKQLIHLAKQSLRDGQDEVDIFFLLHQYFLAQRVAAGTASEAEIAALNAERLARGQKEGLSEFCQRLCTQGERLISVLAQLNGLKYRLGVAIDGAQTLKSLEALMAEFPSELNTIPAKGSATQEV
jgi:hypothetical protein